MSAALLAGVVGGGLLATQSSASPPKNYTVSGSPASVAATPTAASITITNTTNNPISFAAANLDFPAGLTVSSTGLSISQGTVALTEGGTRLELRNMNVVRRASVTVSFQVSAQPSIDCTDYVVTSDVRQSNNFLGSDNRFALSGPEVSFGGPCGVVIECVDNTELCTTGQVLSPGGNVAEVTVLDSESLAATIRAVFLDNVLSCAGRGYTPLSDQLFFDLTEGGGNTFPLAGAVKEVTFTRDATPGWGLYDYHACFQAPYDFPALDLNPGQFEQDFYEDGFWDNTDPAEDGDRKGILLPCTITEGVAQYQVDTSLGLADAPCVSGRELAGGKFTMKILVPAVDPGFRF